MTDRIVVFGREPLPGQVKTRLIPAIGKNGATRVYRYLLERSLRIAAALPHCSTELWCCPDSVSSDYCQYLADQFNTPFRFQQGKNLGERMLHAIETALQGADRVILIGSDCPDYSQPYFESVLKALKTNDAVIGPAHDGGYVSIGFTRVDRRIFDNVAWSTGAVLEQTRHRLLTLGWRWKEMASLRDLDTPEDLKHFPVLTEKMVDSATSDSPPISEI